MATRKLSRWVAGLEYQHIPGPVRDRTKSLLLDTLAVGAAAYHHSESTAALEKAVLQLWGSDGGTYGMLGANKTVGSPATAALVNGVLAHSLDFDDTHSAGSIHPSAPVIPAALAVAELQHSSAEELLTAIVAGYETIIRLSLALDPTEHYRRGYHPTATCGSLAAAVTAAKLLGLDAAGVESSLGIALSSSSGTLKFLEDGAWTKRFQVGYAAHSGVVAAEFAKQKFVGPAAAIEGEHGLLTTMSPAGSPAAVTSGLGEDWETLQIAVKPYPSCRYSHAALDGLAELMKAHSFTDNTVKHVRVGLPKAGMILVGTPLSKRQNPKTVVDGQFSMPFLAAVMLSKGSFGWSDFVCLDDAKVLSLCKRVEAYADPRVEPPATPNFAASLEVELTSGERLEKIVTIPRGEPETFPSEGEMFEKADGLLKEHLPKGGVQRLVDVVLNIEHADNPATALIQATWR